MDQLRVAWAWLVRHHFWVLVVVATLVAFGCWWSGARALYGEFVSNKQTIENEFNSMRQLRQQLFHANDEINNQQKLEIVKQQESVNARWRQLYERQRADVLKWPKNLSQDFHDRIERLKFGDTIPRNLREHYNNYINRHFPELPKIVGARETAEEGQGGYGGGRGSRGYAAEGRTTTRNYGELGPGQTPEEEEDYIVEWLDQQMVRDELYNPTTPTSKRIWKTQEDLWVYEALLGIIARTNEAAGADRFSNAAIRVIESLEVGQLAAQASRGKGRIDLVAPPAAAAAGDLYAEGGGYPAAGDAGREAHAPMGEGGYPMEGDSYFRGGTTDPTAGDALLFTGRYVNEQGMPISSTGEESADVFGKEIKRLPVRMQAQLAVGSFDLTLRSVK